MGTPHHHRGRQRWEHATIDLIVIELIRLGDAKGISFDTFCERLKVRKTDPDSKEIHHSLQRLRNQGLTKYQTSTRGWIWLDPKEGL